MGRLERREIQFAESIIGPRTRHRFTAPCLNDPGYGLRRRADIIRGCRWSSLTPPAWREPEDAIEREGVRRSRDTLAKAELILHVFDASEPLTPADETHLKEFAGRSGLLSGISLI